VYALGGQGLRVLVLVERGAGRVSTLIAVIKDLIAAVEKLCTVLSTDLPAATLGEPAATPGVAASSSARIHQPRK